jgi:Uma2 family endonuclease
MPDIATRTTAAKRQSLPSYKETILDLLPDQGGWTEEAYLWLTDNTNRLVEFTDGVLEPLPFPTTKHQIHLGFLFLAMHEFVEARGGIVLFHVLRLRLRNGMFREPDLLALLDADDARREERFWTGADLVAEVVSEDDPARDLIQKKREYAQAGIAEYWIINPLDDTVAVYRLQGKRYVRFGRFRRGQKATSALLPGLAVDVAALFDAKR